MGIKKLVTSCRQTVIHDINTTRRCRGLERKVSGPEKIGRIPTIEQDGRIKGAGIPLEVTTPQAKAITKSG